MLARPSVGVLGVFLLSAACTNFYEVPVETPLQPKLDVARFQRILVAGFVAGGTEDVDTNLETARLLRSQLRTNSQLEVIDSEVIELRQIAEQQADFVPPRRGSRLEEDPRDTRSSAAENEADADADDDDDDDSLSEEDLEAYEHIFADASYWQQLGEEFQGPLIVTGTVHFAPQQRSGMVSREREVYDAFGRRQVTPIRAYRDRRGFVLTPKFIFIDGETGATLYTERHREEVLYDSSQNTPALSSYFELMDRLLPDFLSTLSTESIRGSRILLK